MKFFQYLIAVLCFVFLIAAKCYSFDQEYVHPNINEASSKSDPPWLDMLLKDIGFAEGILEYFEDNNGVNKEVFKWIRQGGTNEDASLRAFNHFHDPTKPWDSAGLFGMKNSSLIWAQQNDASWSIARENYFQALTTGAESNFTSTFKFLGQLMHLVSDKAVPAHVRDDEHPEVLLTNILEIKHFEVWTKTNRASLNYNGLGPGQAIFTEAIPGQYAPISALWDTDRYNTTNPDITWEPLIGLAEYTNANFFSEDTPFSSEYPYPSKDSSVEKQTKMISDPFDSGREVARMYWIKKVSSDNSSYRLSGIGYLTFTTDSLYLDGFGEFKTLPPMDEYVFKDYADLLVPRAVGYSTALLNYFFRGSLEISPPDQYVYSVIDGSQIDPADNTQTAAVKPLSPRREFTLPAASEKRSRAPTRGNFPSSTVTAKRRCASPGGDRNRPSPSGGEGGRAGVSLPSP